MSAYYDTLSTPALTPEGCCYFCGVIVGHDCDCQLSPYPKCTVCRASYGGKHAVTGKRVSCYCGLEASHEAQGVERTEGHEDLEREVRDGNVQEDSMKALETTLGAHVGCGGEVVYTATATRGTRRCALCGADGRYGRPSPEVDPRPEALLRQARGTFSRRSRLY